MIVGFDRDPLGTPQNKHNVLTTAAALLISVFVRAE